MQQRKGSENASERMKKTITDINEKRRVAAGRARGQAYQGFRTIGR
jgi:hypothetical protein